MIARLRRINERRAVFEAYLLAAALLTGLTGCLLPAARSRSIIASFPTWAQGLWYLGMLVGSTVGLLGIMLRSSENSLMIERAALCLLSGLCASFAIASVGYAGLPALPGTVMLGGFSLASVARIVQINAELREIKVIRAYHTTKLDEST